MQFHRLFIRASLALAASAIASCTVDGNIAGGARPTPQAGGSAAAAKSPNVSPSGVAGQVGEGDGTGGATATPAPTSRPTETPTEAPTVTPQGPPRAVSVRVTPATASVNAQPAAAGSTPLFATTVQLSALVLLSNSLATDSVTWSSSATETAAVDGAGLVTAGKVAGEVLIVARSALETAEGGKATGSCILTVRADGAATVTLK